MKNAQSKLATAIRTLGIKYSIDASALHVVSTQQMRSGYYLAQIWFVSHPNAGNNVCTWTFYSSTCICMPMWNQN